MHNFGLIKLYLDENRKVSLKNRKETLELIQEVCLWQLIPSAQRSGDENSMILDAEILLALCYGENTDYFELFLECIEKDVCFLNRVLKNACVRSLKDILEETLDNIEYFRDYDSRTDEV